jgi:hypothetical protein
MTKLALGCLEQTSGSRGAVVWWLLSTLMDRTYQGCMLHRVETLRRFAKFLIACLDVFQHSRLELSLNGPKMHPQADRQTLIARFAEE